MARSGPTPSSARASSEMLAPWIGLVYRARAGSCCLGGTDIGTDHVPQLGSVGSLGVVFPGDCFDGGD